MISWRPQTMLTLVAIFVVVLGEPSGAAAQDKPSPARAPHARRARAAASAPASRAAKPSQIQVPQPTVVLNPGEAPAVAFKEAAYDFGRALSGTEITHDFEFTNTGNGPLEILRVKPS
jgi:hypothetical protein